MSDNTPILANLPDIDTGTLLNLSGDALSAWSFDFADRCSGTIEEMKMGFGWIAWAMKGKKPDGPYGRWFTDFAERLGISNSTLTEWRSFAMRTLDLELPKGGRTGRPVGSTKRRDLPEIGKSEASAAVPTTVSERGPDAGEGFVALPGSGQPQDVGSVGQSGDAYRPGPPAASDGSPPAGPASSPPVQTPECGPQGASAVKGSELVEPEEQSGATRPSAPTSPGPSRSGAAGRSTSARPAEPDVTVEQAEEAMALLCRARPVVITNSTEFLRLKTIKWLGGLISKPSKPETNGNGSLARREVTTFGKGGK